MKHSKSKSSKNKKSSGKKKKDIAATSKKKSKIKALQQALAWETTLEEALEKIWSNAVSMRKTEDFHQAAVTVFEELSRLRLPFQRCGIGIIDKEKRKGDLWSMTRSKGRNAIAVSGDESLDIHPLLRGVYDAWCRQEDFDYTLEGDDLIHYYEALEKTNFQLPAGSRMPGASSDGRQYFFAATFSGGALFAFSGSPFGPDAREVLKKFSGVFSLSYQRFLDIQKAEAQAREAQVQLALERIRASTMTMQSSQELAATVSVVFKQLMELGIAQTHIRTCAIITFLSESPLGECWITKPDGEIIPTAFHIPYDKILTYRPIYDAWKKGGKFLVVRLKGDELEKHQQYLREYSDIPVKDYRKPGAEEETYTHAMCYSRGFLLVITGEPIPAYHDILQRVGATFEQTYSRFLDLQKAERLARDAQIEASLERVRTKTMAMHTSQDVAETALALFTELGKLGVRPLRSGIGIFHGHQLELWTVYGDDQGEAKIIVGIIDTRIHRLLSELNETWKKGLPSFSYDLEGDDLIHYVTTVNNQPGYATTYELDTLPYRMFHHSFYFPEGALFCFSTDRLSTASKNIFQRFAIVFGQTYRRYLDLKNAEALAREATIEAALERVRSKAMSMQGSRELGWLVGALFKELTRLELKFMRSVIWIFDPATDSAVWWMYNAENPDNPVECFMPYQQQLPYLVCLEQWKKRNPQFQYSLQGKVKKEWDDYLFSHTELRRLPEEVKNEMKAPDQVLLSCSFNNFGGMIVSSLEALTDSEFDLLLRFAKVFDLTYTRFLDLKKAEAQAKDAKIEAALERVRSRAMAMHQSRDFAETASTVFVELGKLGITAVRCGVGLVSKEERKAWLYGAASEGEGQQLSLVGWVELEGHPALQGQYDHWLKGEDYFPVLDEESLRSYYEVLTRHFTVPAEQTREKQYGHFLMCSVGFLFCWSQKPYDTEELAILGRFKMIIDLTFRRFLELQKSEEVAREAVKQAALDRVRAEIASMRTTADLEKITPVIWGELTILKIPFIRCGVFIMDNRDQLIHTFLSTPEGKAIAAFNIPYSTPGNISRVVSHWQEGKPYLDHWDERAFSDFAATLVERGALDAPERYLQSIPRGGFFLHFLPFLQGMLYVGNWTTLDQEDLALVQSVASAFSTAYARYEDFNKLEAAKGQIEHTLQDLRQTQQQLIQSEKMASLGELTAGIAHEIQNPLNFVNNFSEVSNELLDEMTEQIQQGDFEQAKQIAGDIRTNLEKISHHGKRADSIVKGMLQHSRTSSGHKEFTDINALVDEYLRLCYHGLRAKDKSFQVTLKTEYGPGLEKINISPQDTGRVILNLLTNAFYAVTEKKASSTNDYEPTVTVKTVQQGGAVFVEIRDNGNGIAQKNLDKIFQPFFTTKPTGQGTGLGLSLAYDTIKAHRGDIHVRTQEGEYAQFTIELPEQSGL